VLVVDTNTVLRCAGGWVRDKLLGRDSLDIDIALDNMLGKDFAEKV
jgi:tRNA nucleotidyltransferase/poly(A) polymerase